MSDQPAQSKWWDRATTTPEDAAERLGVALDEVPDVFKRHGIPSERAIQAAGEVFGAILADPDEAARIRAHMAEHDARQAAEHSEREEAEQ